ncbi:MAG: hypothetical protein NVS4B9_42290 [Ktedonobacteraceae bacterium]
MPSSFSKTKVGTSALFLSTLPNRDTGRDKTGTEPHDSGTPGPLYFKQRDNEWGYSIPTTLWNGPPQSSSPPLPMKVFAALTV